MSDCAACTRPTGDGAQLCQVCGDDLARDLEDVAGLLPGNQNIDMLPSLAAELGITRCRLDRITGEQVGARSTERPIPWKEGAADAGFVLAHALMAWAGDLSDRRNDPITATTVEEVATWLVRRVDWIRQLPEAEQAAGELIDAIRNARRAVDRPAVLPYAGRCHSCAEHMYARMDRPVVVCRACEHEHNTATLRQSLLDAVEHVNLTVSELAASLPALLGKPLPLATVKKWVSRGQLFRAGRNEQGHAVYRIHDVVRLAMLGPTRPNGTAA